MTIEKAMKILRAVDGIECRFQGYTTALGIAMFALEKRTPKKLVKFNETFYSCPDCMKYFNGMVKPRYCSGCGQALDWRVKNG